MSENEKRFGFSLLSKENHHIAYLEEVMIDKRSGEIVIKTPEGDNISYNFNSRVKSHIIDIKTFANNVGAYGDICIVDFDGKTCPFIMEYDTNYITTPLDIPFKCSKLIIHSDIDPVAVDYNNLTYIRKNILVEIVLAYIYSDGTISNSATVTHTLHTMNNTVLHLTNTSLIDVDDEKTVSGVQIQSYKIINQLYDFHDNETPDDDSIVRSICNSVFILPVKAGR